MLMNILKLFLLLLTLRCGVLQALDSIWETTSPAFVPVHRITKPWYSQGEACFFLQLDGFIKQACVVEGEIWFRCEYSDTLYQMNADGVYSELCPNDPIFYQACPGTSRYNLRRGSSEAVHDLVACKSYICNATLTLSEGMSFKYIQRLWIYDFYCDDDGCSNADLLHEACRGAKKQLDCFGETWGSFFGSKCDGYCDCFDCVDESTCNGYTYGVFCYTFGETWEYVPPIKICNNYRDCSGGEDEASCHGDIEGNWCRNHLFYDESLSEKIGEKVKVLKNHSRCALPSLREDYFTPFLKVCDDFRDQTNCTDDSIAPLVCRLDGYLTTISKYAICQNWELCDDGLESQCVDVSPTCRIHRHELCDGVQNCDGGEDELMESCHLPTLNFTCTRALSPSNTPMPILVEWVRDGVQDCRNGVDEVMDGWFRECGTGSYLTYTQDEGAAGCRDDGPLMTCGQNWKSTALVNLKYLCNTKEQCNKDICLESRSTYRNLLKRPTYSEVFLADVLHCLPGLGTMEGLAGRCVPRLFHGHAVVFGTKPITLRIPESAPRYLKSCAHVFGEIYVFLHCSGICPESRCPLKSIDKNSCPNIQDRVFSVAENQYLTVAQASDRFSVKYFHSQFFRCGNSKCLGYDKVCNLVDDCGDASDESNCTNNFRCEDGGFIPLINKCDGKINCFDFSDECNEDCDIKVKSFPHVSLIVIAILVGLAIMILNLGAIANSIRELLKSKSEKATVNRFFILIISAGDLLMGVYLLTAVMADWLANSSTCRTQFEWTSSTTCSVIGVISTWGSNMSLLAMTVLGLIRAKGLVNPSMAVPREETRIKIKIRLGVAGFLICVVPLVFAVIPLVTFQDYFVEQRSFGVNPLFAGAPDKQKLHDILRRYYRVPIKDLSWENVQTLTSSMFQNEVSDVTVGKPISFYGSTGFCLFKYFIRPGNPQKAFSLALIVFNGACILTMTICYILIQTSAVRSSRRKAAGKKNHYQGKDRGKVEEHNKVDSLGKRSPEDEANNRNKKLLMKVIYLTSTNILTWIPFICVCVVHYFNLGDLSGAYSIISIVVLSINAIINPIGLYHEFIAQVIKRIKYAVGK